MTEKRPYRTWRTGTVTFTIIEAHPYHKQTWPRHPFRQCGMKSTVSCVHRLDEPSGHTTAQ
jgi:hypothetical protein